MYPITDKQIDYILDDIRRNGIHMEDLQLNLLDHICCLLEQNLKAEDDFEAYYHKTVRHFYSKELKEIEEETIRLLTFKNYFMMKKIMIAAGAFSTFAFLFGSFFKIMHWPGAAVLLTLGVLIFCLSFLPLLFILKSKEVNTGLDKLVIAVGTVLGIIFCLSILFKVQHWPGATIMLFLMIGFSFFIFIPLYFFNGYKKAETRTNTVLTTILLVGFTAVTFLSVNLKDSTKQFEDWTAYYQNEMILQKVASKSHISDESAASTVLKNCSGLKKVILAMSGAPQSKMDYTMPPHLRIASIGSLGNKNDYEDVQHQLQNIQASVNKYNQIQTTDENKIPDGFAFLDMSADEFNSQQNLSVLNKLTQLQTYLMSIAAEKSTVAIK